MAGEHEQDSAAASGRREAIKKLGLFGAYAAPAMIVLLKSEKAIAQSGGGGGTQLD